MIRHMFVRFFFCFLAPGLLYAQDTPPVLDSQPPVQPIPTVAAMRYTAAVLRDQAVDAEKRLEYRVETTRQMRDSLDKLVKSAKKDSTLSADSLKTLTTNLAGVKELEKIAKNELKKAEKAIAFAEKTTKADSLTLLKSLPKLIADVQEIQAVAAQLPDQSQTPIATILIPEGVSDPAAVPLDTVLASIEDTLANQPATKPKKEKPQKSVAPSARFKPYDPAQDVMLNPPTPPCLLAQQRRDEFSGEVYTELKREEIFRQTPAVLKNYLKGKPQVTGEAAISSTSGGVLTMHLWFKINDPNPRKAFGTLTKDGILLLRFIDGTTLNLTNQTADEGTPDADGGPTVYHGQYLIDKAQVKKLQKTPLDKIRVAWSAGYEDYDLYDIEVFIRQLKCLL